MVGIESYISNAIELYTESLWVGFNNSFYGKSDRIKQKATGNILPYVYDDNGEYIEVLASDNSDSIVHFDVENTIGVISEQQLLNVNIFFAVNLSEVYGDTTRSASQALADIIEVTRYTSFTVANAVVDIDAYSIYDLNEEELIKFNMQPYYIIKLETTIMAAIGSCKSTTPTIKRPVTISIDGDGVTNPATGSYQIENGETLQLIAAPNSGNEFVRYEEAISGDVGTEPVLNLLIDGAKKIIAYFSSIIQGLQVVIGTTLQNINSLWYSDDSSENDNKVQLTNIQHAKFSGSEYLQFDDLTGVTITGVVGTALPSINSNAIEFTSGYMYALSLSNGLIGYFNEGSQDEIFFTDGINIEIATVENVILDDFWENKSEYGTPATYNRGVCQYLVCESAGTVTTLGDPSGENLGDNIVTNGDFSDGSTSWAIQGESEINNGSARIYTSTGDNSAVLQSIADYANKPMRLEFDVTDSDPNNEDVCVVFASRVSSGAFALIFNTDGHYSCIFDSNDNAVGILFKRAGYGGMLDLRIDNIILKEVESISIHDTYVYKIKPSSSDTYFIDVADVTASNGYMVRATTTAITLYRVDAGVLTQLSTSSLTIADYSDISITITESGLTVSVNDVEQLTSSDITYTTFKLLVIDNDAGDEISHMSKGGARHNPNDFCCGTGSFGVQNVIGLNDFVDCKGNDLEIQKEVFSDTGIKLKGILYTDWEDQEIDFETINNTVDNATIEITRDSDSQAITQIKINE